MSSEYVRDQFELYVSGLYPGKSVGDIAAQSDLLEDFLDDNGISIDSNWLALQFLPADERPISVMSNNSVGCYREEGSVFIHVVNPIKKTARDEILAVAENLRNNLRGKRINNDIVIQSVTPPNFESGGTLQFEGGFTSASVVVNYYRDFSL